MARKPKRVFKARGRRPTTRVWRDKFGIDPLTGSLYPVKMTAVKWPTKGLIIGRLYKRRKK